MGLSKRLTAEYCFLSATVRRAWNKAGMLRSHPEHDSDSPTLPQCFAQGQIQKTNGKMPETVKENKWTWICGTWKCCILFRALFHTPNWNELKQQNLNTLFFLLDWTSLFSFPWIKKNVDSNKNMSTIKITFYIKILCKLWGANTYLPYISTIYISCGLKELVYPELSHEEVLSPLGSGWLYLRPS